MHPLERVLVVAHTVIHFAEEQVAFGIGGNTVNMEELTGIVPRVPAYRTDDFQCFPIQHPDGFIGAIDNIQIRLVLVGGNRKSMNGPFRLKCVPGDKDFLDERPVEVKYLKIGRASCRERV